MVILHGSSWVVVTNELKSKQTGPQQVLIQVARSGLRFQFHLAADLWAVVWDVMLVAQNPNLHPQFLASGEMVQPMDVLDVILRQLRTANRSVQKKWLMRSLIK